MKNIAKKIIRYTPPFIGILLFKLYCFYYSYLTKLTVGGIENKKTQNNIKPKILFYHLNGLSFGGTEKFLQILSKHLNKEKYNVSFAYSTKSRMNKQNRLEYLKNSGVNLVEFEYENIISKYPYIVRCMKPNIFEILKKENVDLFITAGSGYPEFPTNIIRNTPILMINIFGSPNVQKNVALNVCISKEVKSKIEKYTNKKKLEVMYIPSEGPSINALSEGNKLRESLGIKSTDFVFGRIGRADNGIFDPIGINAFKRVVKDFPNTYYLIVSPPPILVEKVRKEKIPNVIFIDATADENKIWAFHKAIDALAHFRNDGESCGLNIAESMLCGKPIITHKSHIWNAHLEYLEPAFSRVSEKDDVNQYAKYMKEFIEAKNNNQLIDMGILSKNKADSIFLIKNNIAKFENWIDNIIKPS